MLKVQPTLLPSIFTKGNDDGLFAGSETCAYQCTHWRWESCEQCVYPS